MWVAKQIERDHIIDNFAKDYVRNEWERKTKIKESEVKIISEKNYPMYDMPTRILNISFTRH